MNGNQTSQNGSLLESLESEGTVLLYLAASTGGMKSSPCVETVTNALASGETQDEWENLVM